MAEVLKINEGSLSYLDQGDVSNPAIVFLHGNSASSSSFIKQFESDLVHSFRLVALDLPGHGQSQDFRNVAPDYSLPFYGDCVLKWLSALHLRKFIVVGHSLGGHIALEIANQIPNAVGILILGTPPLGKPLRTDLALLPNPHLGSLFTAEPPKHDVALLMNDFFFNPETKGLQLFTKSFEETDPKARERILASLIRENFRDEIRTVNELRVPLCVVEGTNEKFVNSQYYSTLSIPTLWRNQIQFIGQSAHCPHYENPKEFHSILRNFAHELFA